MSNSSRTAYLSLVGAALFWSLSGMFIYFLNRSLGPFAQSGARYGAASISLFIISAILFRKEVVVKDKAVLKLVLLAGFAGLVFQMIWVYSLYFIQPGTASLLGEFGTLVSLAIFCIFDKSERAVARKFSFWIAVMVMLLGASLVILFKPSNTFDFNKGAALVLLCQCCWAFYMLVVKRILKKLNPLVAMAYISFAISIFHFIPGIITGQVAALGELPLRTVLILIASGVFSIAGAHSCFYTAVNKLGVVVSNNSMLIQPLLVCLLSYLVFGEYLTLPQIAGGCLLLLGAWLTYKVKPGKNEN
jgi:drug/metabolite transporter (DMT)-like permease